VCGEHVDGTRRRVDHAPPSARPCRSCFTEQVVEAHTGRDGAAPGVLRATDGGRDTGN